MIAITTMCMLQGCGKGNDKEMEEINKANQMMGVSVHDPSIVESDGKYYIFGSHMTAAVSDDLQKFKMFADGVNASNKLFTNLFDDKKEAFAFTDTFTDGGYAVWAPDVIYNKDMGKWTMYFCTSHDYRTSSLCMATADAIEGPYTFQKTLLHSGFTRTTVEKTNFFDVMGTDADVSPYLAQGQYNNLKYPNCIDPTVFYDKEDRLWMVYGSWSGGIFLLELDKETGEPIHPQADEEKKIDQYFGYHLIGGLHNSCEGPYILYDEGTDYYYLFVSYGGLTREGGYQIRQFRAKDVTGPYLDASGETLGFVSEHSQYGIKMMGNYEFPSLKTAYMAPGHNSALHGSDGKYYLVYHQRMNGGTEYHEPRVHQMYLNEDGWFVAAPFAYEGEDNATFEMDAKSFAGTYYSLNHGTDISATIQEAKPWKFDNKGKVSTEDGNKGSYEIKDKYITITIMDETYKGVVGNMKDEAGNPITFVSAVSDQNETIWCVKYMAD